MTLHDSIEARILAYIHPRAPTNGEQEEALAAAIDAQVEHEQALDADGIPGNVQSFSTGSMSVTFAEGRTGAYTRATLCPAAWALLFNAGLIRYALPVARRL